jgi:hypothetical protein
MTHSRRNKLVRHLARMDQRLAMFEHWTACPYLTSEERGYLAEHIAYHRIVSMRIEELLAGRNDKQV